MPDMNTETKAPSERQLACERLATFIRENNLAQVYGGDVSLQRLPRPHYTTAFSICRVLDGSIELYSPTFICVKWLTQFRDMPHDSKRVFLTVDTALEFLRLAFVEHKFAEALALPHKG